MLSAIYQMVGRNYFCMTNTKTKHLQLERETWLRTLDYMQQENIYFKTNLAYIIKNGVDASMLEQAEHFQSIFINKDTMIALLRNDISLLANNQEQGKATKENIDRRAAEQDEIRSGIATIEQEFSKLKILFAEYMAKALL